MTQAHGPQRILRDIILTELELELFRERRADLLRIHGIDPSQPYEDYALRDRAARRFIQWQQDDPLPLPEDDGHG